MKIADVRVIQADIPVERPHKMSFTTLEAVNFVFVRLETADGLVGWGEAACLGGPTWSEESSESIAATIERYIAPWLVGRDATGIEPVAREMARRVQGNPIRAGRGGDGALGSQRARARRTRAPAARRPGARSRAALLVPGRGRSRTRRSRRRGPRSRVGIASSRSRRRPVPSRRTSRACGASARLSVPTSRSVSTPIRAGTGRPRSPPSARSRRST